MKMVSINSSDSSVVFPCLFQPEFLFFLARYGPSLCVKGKKMERCASLSKEMMTAGGRRRKVQNQLKMQYVAYSDCCHFLCSLALLLDLKVKNSCILFLQCSLTCTACE